jgi:hypothetical protein
LTDILEKTNHNTENSTETKSIAYTAPSQSNLEERASLLSEIDKLFNDLRGKGDELNVTSEELARGKNSFKSGKVTVRTFKVGN